MVLTIILGGVKWINVGNMTSHLQINTQKTNKNKNFW